MTPRERAEKVFNSPRFIMNRDDLDEGVQIGVRLIEKALIEAEQKGYLRGLEFAYEALDEQSSAGYCAEDTLNFIKNEIQKAKKEMGK